MSTRNSHAPSDPEPEMLQDPNTVYLRLHEPGNDVNFERGCNPIMSAVRVSEDEFNEVLCNFGKANKENLQHFE